MLLFLKVTFIFFKLNDAKLYIYRDALSAWILLMSGRKGIWPVRKIGIGRLVVVISLELFMS